MATANITPMATMVSATNHLTHAWTKTPLSNQTNSS
jgi:hypothetical protein